MASKWRWHSGALAIYAALAFMFIDHGVSITRNLSGQGSDPFDSPWFLAWWPWAISHHADPFFTTRIWYPAGVPLMWVTSVPALALLAAPLTMFAGPIVSYNLYIILAPALSAWFAYRVCQHLAHDPVAALIGGFLFGFSSYEMAQDCGALNLCFTCCVPALLWAVLARLNGQLSRLRFALLAGLILILQFLIFIEIFAMIFVFGGIAWGLAMILAPAWRVALRRLFVDGLYAAPLVLFCLVPFLASMLRHNGYANHPAFWPYYFTADLANILVPSPYNAFAAFVPRLSHSFNGSQELGAYIGVPLLAIICFFARECGQSAAGKILLTLFLVYLVLSLGPILWVAGAPTSLVLPWALFVHVPLLRDALPARFALFVSLVCGIIAALWIAKPSARGARVALGALACLALAPAPHPWRPIPYAKFFEPGRLQAVLGSNPRLVILPFGIGGPSSLWQLENGFNFTQVGGYLGYPPSAMQHFAAIWEFEGNDTVPTFTRDVTVFCRQNGAQFVVAGPGTRSSLRAALDRLNWVERQVGDVTVYTVPGGARG